MKKLLFHFALTPAFALAGDLWEWSPGHFSYRGKDGYEAEGWEWSKGHTTWTDNRGHRKEVWEWSPGHFSIDED